MTIGGVLISFFPLVHLLLIVGSMLLLVFSHHLLHVLTLLFAIYGFPVLTFRIHNLFFPLQEGTFDLSVKSYNHWWATHKIQFLFVAVPILEAPFHFVPGAFSFWLRLWGSKIGKNVFWTPRVEVIDRGLLEIGDNAVIGHIAAFCCHVVSPKGGRPFLIIKKIHVGKNAFIGADCQLGPGARVHPGELLKTKSAIYWRGRYE